MFKIQLQDYSIYTGDVIQLLNEFVQNGNYSKVAILTDENVSKHCLDLLPEALVQHATLIVIPPGEEQKNLSTCQQVWEAMLKAGLDRTSLLVNLGGGVIGDLGGFCAATYFRGIDFIQAPTTLLAMADASIGGKLGVDLLNLKNAVGVFQNPKTVFMHTAFLKSLPPEELYSGFAEVIKHALIADASLWSEIKEIKTLEQDSFDELLHKSLLVKKSIVEQDPFEQNIRKALNFGHTVGHAIESYRLNIGAPIKHGEAVALGMICECWLSSELSGMSKTDMNEIARFIPQLYKVQCIAAGDYDQIINLMKKDKKNRGGSINCTLLQSIGLYTIDNFVEEAMIRRSLDFLALSQKH
jgi:3-dehydroquinate synthase